MVEGDGAQIPGGSPSDRPPPKYEGAGRGKAGHGGQRVGAEQRALWRTSGDGVPEG